MGYHETFIVGLVCGSIVLCVFGVCIALFSGSFVGTPPIALPSNFERLVEWLRERRRIIAEERIQLAKAEAEGGALLRARCALLEERLQWIRDVHEKCQAPDCRTCKALKA